MTELAADAPLDVPSGGRSATWRWAICVLLMLATVVNYMDRLTVNNLSIEIQRAFDLNDREYGYTELGFGLSFAAGSLLFGWLVDRMGVYWLYPVVLIGWSAMGFLTGLSHSFRELVALRCLLGLFEAGHFPCGLKTVQLLLAPRDRALGNSLLQGGTALGAIIAPQAIKLLMTDGDSGWRRPFLVIGAGGGRRGWSSGSSRSARATWSRPSGRARGRPSTATRRVGAGSGRSSGRPSSSRWP